MRSRDRVLCRGCHAKLLILTVGSKRVPVTYPGDGSGTIAAAQYDGRWWAWRHDPAVPVRPPEKLFRPHQCPAVPPPHDLSQPRRGAA
jgi:hypothetical protein